MPEYGVANAVPEHHNVLSNKRIMMFCLITMFPQTYYLKDFCSINIALKAAIKDSFAAERCFL